MAARKSLVLVLAAAFASLGAEYRTPNFDVSAPTPEIAQQIGQYAEYYRKQKAMLWLGQEMPQWPEPIPLRVTILRDGSSGATEFGFDRGYILSQRMHIEGPLDRLTASVLPHEVTHTVFAYYFRQPLPRWADEGGAVLSEDDIERNRHDHLVRSILNTPGRAIPLRRLFSLREYPPDVMVLYAEGYSVANFLVGSSSRQVFLNFVAQGMRGDWDAAVRANYGYNSVEELEKAWVESLYKARRQQPTDVAARPAPPAAARPAEQVVMRQTAPPAPPLLEAPRPVVRGQAPDADSYAADAKTPDAQQWWRPSAAPDAQPAAATPTGWSGTPIPPPPPLQVRLGAPRGDVPPAPPRLGAPAGSQP